MFNLDGKGETTHGLKHGGQTHSTWTTMLRKKRESNKTKDKFPDRQADTVQSTKFLVFVAKLSTWIFLFIYLLKIEQGHYGKE